MCDEDTYCHRYFVDGSPVVGDIFDGNKMADMLVSGLGKEERHILPLILQAGII
jgi:Tfp pilus tip-associated adhesin PilY1